MHRSLLLPAVALGLVTALPSAASAQSAVTGIKIAKPKIPVIPIGPVIPIDPVPMPLPDGAVRRYAPMLHATVVGRESSLPLCGVADETDSPYYPVWQQRTWRCTDADGDDCAWQSPVRPNEDEYWIRPAEPYYNRNLLWPDDDAAFGVYGVHCRRNASSQSSDIVVSNNIEGRITTPAPYGPLRYLDSEYAVLHGGYVEHVEPAYARASVRVRRNDAWRTDYQGDLILAIQMLGDGGWVDVATREVTTTWSYRTYSVEAMVPELTDVRVLLRGKHDRQNHLGASLQVKWARIFVEQCIPDLSNPGQCLE
jgi:hypothetical protein